MGIQTLDTDQMLQALAQAERECHGVQNGPEPEGVHRGCGCAGAGTVPLIPGLRRKCTCSDCCGSASLGVRCTLDCFCQGRNWLPASIPEAAKIIRQDEQFRDWLETSYWGALNVRRLIDLLCTDELVIAARYRMLQETGE